jgi:hypothetical protein
MLTLDGVALLPYAVAYIDSDPGMEDRRRSLYYALQTAPQRLEAERQEKARAAELAARAMGMA